MTEREVFDKIKTHLLTQMSKSMLDDGERCAYRGHNGRMCAIGCLIPDEDYKPIMEMATMNSVKTMNGVWTSAAGAWCKDTQGATSASLLADVLNKQEIPISLHPVLRQLQTVHDQHDPEEWAQCLDAIERDHFGRLFEICGAETTFPQNGLVDYGKCYLPKGDHGDNHFYK